MKKSFLCASLLLALRFAMPAYGNIGESDTQLLARNGASQAEDKNPYDGLVTKCYSHEGFWIRARFLEGSSQSEAYVKLDKSAISNGEIAHLLEANARGGKWANIYKGADTQRWVLDSHAAVAQYFTKDHLLVITTKDMMRYIAGKGRLDKEGLN